MGDQHGTLPATQGHVEVVLAWLEALSDDFDFLLQEAGVERHRHPAETTGRLLLATLRGGDPVDAYRERLAAETARQSKIPVPTHGPMHRYNEIALAQRQGNR